MKLLQRLNDVDKFSHESLSAVHLSIVIYPIYSFVIIFLFLLVSRILHNRNL